MVTKNAALKAYFETGDTPTQSQFGELIDSVPTLLWSEDFTGASYDTTVIKTFNSATLTFDAVNDALKVSGGAYKGFYLDEAVLGLVDGEWYAIELIWQQNTGGNISAKSSWTDAASVVKSFGKAAEPAVFFHRQSSGGSGVNYSPMFMNQATGENWIKSIKVWKAVPTPSDMYGTTGNFIVGSAVSINSGVPVNSILIGNYIVTGDGSSEVLIGSGVLGAAARAAEHNVGIGANVSLVTGLVGSTSANGDRTAIGSVAKAASWRATSVGAKAGAMATSSTAIGWGAYTEVTHTCVLGRDVFVPYAVNSLVQSAVVFGGQELYLGNGTMHYCDALPNGATIAEETGNPPSAFPCSIHGKNAFDARAAPADLNVKGGDLNVCAGKGTGTNVSGNVNLRIATGGVSGNTQGTLTDALRVDPNTTAGQTRMMLWDVDAGSLVRVSVGAADSGGTGFKVLRVPN